MVTKDLKLGDKSLLMANIKKSPRNLAVTVLDRIINKQAYSNLELNQVIQQNELSVADKHLLTNLVYGTLQHRLTLENWLKSFVKFRGDFLMFAISNDLSPNFKSLVTI